MRCRAFGEGDLGRNGLKSSGMGNRWARADTPEFKRLAAAYTVEHCVDLLTLDPAGADRLYWLSHGRRVAASGAVVVAAAARRSAKRLVVLPTCSIEGSASPQPRRAGRESQA